MCSKFINLKTELTIFFMVIFTTTALNAQQRDTIRLTLDQAIAIALNDNISVKVADEELQRVDYLKKENWYALLPSVNAQASYTNNIIKPVMFFDMGTGEPMKITIGYNNTTTFAGAVQLPVFSMALYKQIQISELDMKTALESARSTKIDLIEQVKNAFYGIVMSEESLSVLRSSYENAMESAMNIKKMYELGMASEYDKIRSEVAARNIAPSLTQAENMLSLAKMQFNMLLSISLDTPIKVIGEFNRYQEEILNYVPNLTYSFLGNSSLRTMDLNQQKLSKSFELIRSQRYPTISASMSYNIQTQENEFTYAAPWVNSLSAGFTVSVPIFNKLSISLKEKQTRSSMKQLELQKELLKTNLSLTAQNSINEMIRAKKQLISDKEAVVQATKGYEIAKVRYQTGSGTVLELNDSEIALTTSRINLNQTIYNYLKAKNGLERILGIDNK
ncbi:MAG: TolC family protein [Bacteroidales bacterium]|jgi:outer membrane protein TolC